MKKSLIIFWLVGLSCGCVSINGEEKKSVISITASAPGTSNPQRIANNSNLMSIARTINYTVNSTISYTNDQEQYNTPDYWQTSLETFELRSGDCEDIAILKYDILYRAGVPLDKLRLLEVLLTDATTGVTSHHVVLSVVDSNERQQILDSATFDLMPLKLRKDLTLVKVLELDTLYRQKSDDSTLLLRDKITSLL